MTDSTVLELQYSPMQFGDTDAQMASDVDKIFRRGARIMAGSEAGGEKAKPLPDLLRAACEKYGYRFHMGKGDWLAIDRDLVAGGWESGYEHVLDASDGVGAHTDRGVPWVSFETERLGRITVGCGHYLTNGRVKGDPNYEWNVRYARTIGEWGREHGAGRAGVVFYLGDQNTPDRALDTFHGQPFTSLWDELGKWQNTGHGNIDVIATYDPDERVEAVSIRALDDRELALHTDHFLTVGRVRVGHYREPEGRGFDAARIAERAVRRGEDPLAAVIGQLAGYASVCWEPRPAGVFDSGLAGAAVDSAVEWLRSQGGGVPVVDLDAGDRVLLLAPALTAEDAARFQAALVEDGPALLLAEASAGVVIRGGRGS